jgi:septum formation protein
MDERPRLSQKKKGERSPPPRGRVSLARALSKLGYSSRKAAEELVRDGRVSLDGRLVGKPADRDQARRILSTLAGTTHQVISGVTLYQPAADRRLIEHAVTYVTMRPMSDAELEGYLDTGEWQGKAGAYAIQEHADAFVTRTEGSFTNVIGLPMELLAEMLVRFGVRPQKGLASHRR